MGIKVVVQETNFKKLKNAFKGLENDATVRTRINQALADKCDSYVPYQTGALANNVKVTEEGIHYTQPYAAEQYYGEFNHNTSVHPLATSHWGAVALQNHKDELNAEIRDIVKDRLKELKDG